MTDADRVRYADCMTEIKLRIDSALGFLDPPITHSRVEAAALQLRLTLETIVLSSLIVNRAEAKAVAAAFEKANHEEARRIARRVNPRYWPKPTVQQVDGPGHFTLLAVADGYLREEDYGPTWGRLSTWLHARNPYALERDLVAGVTMMRYVIDAVTTLLQHHQLELVDQNYMIVCVMNSKDDGRVHVAGFARQVEPDG